MVVNVFYFIRNLFSVLIPHMCLTVRPLMSSEKPQTVISPVYIIVTELIEVKLQ
jgi:hypothetical protein